MSAKAIDKEDEARKADDHGYAAAFEQLKAEHQQLKETHEATLVELQAVLEQLRSVLEKQQSAQQQLDWFKRQLFGSKSEKRHDLDPKRQSDLLSELAPSPPSPPAGESDSEQPTQPAKKRKKRRPGDSVSATGLRFGPDVPVETIELPCEEIEGLAPEDVERIGEKVSFKLVQQPGSYKVIKYVMPTYKRKADAKVVSTPPAPAVLERSFADVSFLAGMLCDKFQYHIPLYRQHQRLEQAGIMVSRASLTHLTRRAIELLEPIYDAQMAHVLQSRVLAMDETPIKAGRDKGGGKMKQAYFWPMYGEDDELVFPFTHSKDFKTLERLLDGWGRRADGTLLSDGAAVYAKYAEQLDVLLANCWSHSRREFEKAKDSTPQESADALIYIGELYRHEELIRDRGLEGEQKQAYRNEHSRPIVEAFWQWCEAQSQRAWSSVDPIGKALKYVHARKAALEVFLSDPDVAIDTNHLERGLRPVPMGRRAWLFCWTELGAKHTGIIQSLVATARLHGVHVYTYLVDVLQRVAYHPASRVEELTPRLWKELFAHRPLRSVAQRQ